MELRRGKPSILQINARGSHPTLRQGNWRCKITLGRLTSFLRSIPIL